MAPKNPQTFFFFIVFAVTLMSVTILFIFHSSADYTISSRVAVQV